MSASSAKDVLWMLVTAAVVGWLARTFFDPQLREGWIGMLRFWGLILGAFLVLITLAYLLPLDG